MNIIIQEFHPLRVSSYSFLSNKQQRVFLFAYPRTYDLQGVSCEDIFKETKRTKWFIRNTLYDTCTFFPF
jgi:hypothetical protein